MLLKKRLLVIWIVSLFLLCSFVCSAKDVYFYDKDVFVIGSCRTIYSSDIGNMSWVGGLFKGFLPYAGCSTSNMDGGVFFVLVRDGSSVVYSGVSSHVLVFTVNSTGVFFWSKKGAGICLLPPFIFVRCHSEVVRVMTD
jgi:hypothetical protein